MKLLKRKKVRLGRKCSIKPADEKVVTELRQRTAKDPRGIPNLSSIVGHNAQEPLHGLEDLKELVLEDSPFITASIGID